MEQGLLNRIEKYDLKTQMNAFYTAYSKVGLALSHEYQATDMSYAVHCCPL